MWFAYSVFAAFSRSLTGIFKKAGLRAAIDEYQFAFNIKAIAVPFLAVFVVIEGEPQNLDYSFWVSLIVAGTLTAVTTVLILKAFKASELSLVYPLMAFLPVFLLLSSYLMLGELPPAIGLIGVALVSFGAYIINMRRGDRLLAPVKRLISSQGPRLMIIVILIWSITSNVDKIATESVTPLFWTFSLLCFMSVVLFVFNLAMGKPVVLPKNIKKKQIIFAASLVTVLALLLQVIAIQDAYVSYVHAVKRLDILITIFLSWILFHEHNVKRRLEGGVIMLMGIYLIVK